MFRIIGWRCVSSLLVYAMQFERRIKAKERDNERETERKREERLVVMIFVHRIPVCFQQHLNFRVNTFHPITNQQQIPYRNERYCFAFCKIHLTQTHTPIHTHTHGRPTDMRAIVSIEWMDVALALPECLLRKPFTYYMKINLKLVQLWRHLPTPPSAQIYSITFV